LIIKDDKAIKIPNLKSQIPNKSQITMTKIPNNRGVCDFEFGDWNLFVIWCLEFGAYCLILPIHLVF